jgi:hypothetical protein
MRRPAGQGEALTAWAVWAVLLVVVAVTYSRLPVLDLYRVSHGGLGGGLGRAVVLSNFPIALVAIALMLIAVDALPRRVWWAAAPAIVLCATTVFTVDPNDLDVRLVNVLPAAGVVIAVAITAGALGRRGAGFSPRLRGDPARLAIGAIVLLVSLPWLAADLGMYLPGAVFLTNRLVTEGSETLAAVHRGHHHGMDGALLLLTALLLSRVRAAGRRLRVALTAYLSLMLAYGAMNAAEDAWHEQVVKRGWAHARIPPAQVPSVSGVWLAILLLAGIVYPVLAYERRLDDLDAPATSPSSPARP